jgi:archaellum biogenesis protein FlaJ (TadC family)
MFTKSSQKRTAKETSDSNILSFDLLSNLTYMAAASEGNSPRDLILEWTLKQNYKTVHYFRQVYILAKRTGFEYSRAFQMVARRTKAEIVKSFLLRFAGAISSGYPEKDFLQGKPGLIASTTSMATIAAWKP